LQTPQIFGCGVNIGLSRMRHLAAEWEMCDKEFKAT